MLSIIAAASNPEMVDSSLMSGDRVSWIWSLRAMVGVALLSAFFPSSLLLLPQCFPSSSPSFLFSYHLLFLPPSLSFHLEPVSTPPAHRHEVTYVTTHKGPSLAAMFSRDGTSECQRFLRLQESVLVHFSLLRSTCCYRLC